MRQPRHAAQTIQRHSAHTLGTLGSGRQLNSRSGRHGHLLDHLFLAGQLQRGPGMPAGRVGFEQGERGWN